MTIVCATDFSEASFSAVKVASTLAKRHRQPLWLVHVLPKRVRGQTIRLETAARDALSLEAAALTNDGVEVKTRVLQGALADTISHFCSDQKAQLLVVGDTRQHHTVLPTSLDQFVHGVQTPMLVVRDARPFDAWARGQGPLKVMLALDHSWSSAVARDWMLRLCEYGPIDLIAAHIFWPRDEYNRRGLIAPPAEEAHAALSGLLKNETEEALAGLPAGVRYRVLLKIGVAHIGEQLMELAEDERVDVLVLGTHPHYGPIGRLSSTSHQVFDLAPMSVAVVPGNEPAPA